MNATRSKKTMRLFLILFLLFAANIGNLTAGEINAADQKIIDAGVRKAKELGVNPIPICEKDDGNNYVPAGFMFGMGNGGVGLKNGDMLINAAKTNITAAGVPLARGEYAIIENDKAKKGENNLISE